MLATVNSFVTVFGAGLRYVTVMISPLANYNTKEGNELKVENPPAILGYKN